MIALALPAVAALGAIAAAAVGVALLGKGHPARILVPLSGGLLAGVAIFGLLPELVRQLGTVRASLFVAVGYGCLMVVDRSIYAICPTCSHDHHHHHHDVTLRGFAWPLISATALHAFVDGWGLVTIQRGAANPLAGGGLTAALLLHKIPEGLALGTILRASTGTGSAIAWCAAAELMTVAGGAFGLWLVPDGWLSYPLAVACGTFLFLGVHAVQGDWKRGRARATFVPALAGVAGAAILEQGLRFVSL